MAWSYSGNPNLSDKDAVRFLIGDTDTNEQLSTDEEILWSLNQNPNIYGAAGIVARAISAKFSTMADSTEIGPIKVDYGKRAENYAKKASELESKSNFNQRLNIYGGGLEVSDKESNRLDDSLIQPSIRKGITDTEDFYYEDLTRQG